MSPQSTIPTTTPVHPATAPWPINHQSHVLLLGSCFADNIGQRMLQCGFDALCNPFGTLYNPLSIATLLQRCATQQPITADDLVQHDNLWHSWLHHTTFSRSNKEECLSVCNDAMRRTYSFLQHADTVIITLGTAFVYRLLDHEANPGRIVANCHKVPQAYFDRSMLSIQDCVDALQSMPLQGKHIICTVSPIRHMADGAHQNQISKATLLLALHQMEQKKWCYYFPAYEIMMDQLRDYRYYERDMTHPSSLAIDIIWQQFADTFFSPATQQQAQKQHRLWQQGQHHTIAHQQ